MKGHMLLEKRNDIYHEGSYVALNNIRGMIHHGYPMKDPSLSKNQKWNDSTPFTCMKMYVDDFEMINKD